MPGFPVPFIKFSAYDANGNPLAGGKLSSFEAGTSTPLATYTTHIVPPDILAVPNTNPTILDAQGRADIFVPDGVGYKFILTDALDNVIWTLDNIMVPEVEAPPTPSEVPPGGIIMFGGTTAPAGWLLCDGSTISRFTPYDLLFAAIQERFGPGNGVSTVQLPNMSQRFPLGLAVSGTGSVLGGTGGLIDHVHSGPSHIHAIDAHVHDVLPHTHPVPRGSWARGGPTNPDTADMILVGGGAGVNNYQPLADNTSGASVTANTALNTGSSLATIAGGTANTGTANPAFLSLNFIIKY